MFNNKKKKDNQMELWSPIVGYEDLYEVSNFGNVKSLGRTLRDSLGRVRTMKEKLMSPSVTSKRKGEDVGYLEVRLTDKNKNGKNYLVHRLVAEAFIPNPEFKPTVNHIDGDKHNNDSENLEWASYSENNFHAYENDLKRDNKYVVRTNELGDVIGIYKSMHEAGRVTGVDYRRIHRLCNSLDGYDGEYYWDYVENFEVSNKTLYFAKTKEGAKIPSQESGSAGYDFYAHIEGEFLENHNGDKVLAKEQYLKKNEVNFVSTGIASAMSEGFCLNFKNERSSFAKHGATVVAGLIDSNYRGEIKLMIIPLVKDIVITDQIEKPEENEDAILIPYSKAFAQGRLEVVPRSTAKEIEYEELQAIPSERGTGGWGSTDK